MFWHDHDQQVLLGVAIRCVKLPLCGVGSRSDLVLPYGVYVEGSGYTTNNGLIDYPVTPLARTARSLVVLSVSRYLLVGHETACFSPPRIDKYYRFSDAPEDEGSRGRQPQQSPFFAEVFAVVNINALIDYWPSVIEVDDNSRFLLVRPSLLYRRVDSDSRFLFDPS